VAGEEDRVLVLLRKHESGGGRCARGRHPLCHGRGKAGQCLALSPLAAEPFAERMAPCLACHGEKGVSATPEVPSLGGQTAPYLLIQLYLFREKQRTVEIMNGMTKDFTDDDLRTFSDTLSKLPPPPAIPREDADRARA
jgi:cytochrome c553